MEAGKPLLVGTAVVALAVAALLTPLLQRAPATPPSSSTPGAFDQSSNVGEPKEAKSKQANKKKKKKSTQPQQQQQPQQPQPPPQSQTVQQNGGPKRGDVKPAAPAPAAAAAPAKRDQASTSQLPPEADDDAADVASVGKPGQRDAPKPSELDPAAAASAPPQTSATQARQQAERRALRSAFGAAADMLDADVDEEPEYARVARVSGARGRVAREKNHDGSEGYSLGHSADEGEEADGWQSVGNKGAKVNGSAVVAVPNGSSRGKAKGGGATIASWATSNPFASLPGSGAGAARPNGSAVANGGGGGGVTAARGASSPSSATGTMTKKQRQNAKRNEARKAAKAEDEAERRRALTQHKRELDRERLKQQQQQVGGASDKVVPKSVSRGGLDARASISPTGKLIWE